MAQKKTTIVFDQAGGMKVDAIGFVGKACEETTGKLLAGLGSKATEEHKKPEYNQRASVGAAASLPSKW